MSTNIKSLADAASTAVGEYISGGFQAVIVSARTFNTKTGKTMYKAKLSEGDLTADATSFSTDFAPHTGKLVKWVGMGMKRGDDYNGIAQITLGDKVRWIPTSDAPTAPIPTTSTVNKSTNTTQSNSSRIEGVTIGMAINKAVDIAINSGNTENDVIWKIASDLVRIAQKMQRGDLAPEEQVEPMDSEKEPF